MNELKQPDQLRLAFCLLVIITIGVGVAANTDISFEQERKARIFDKFGLLRTEDLKARLDDFAVQLYNEPAADGHIKFQTGRRRPSTEMEEMAKTSKDYVVNQRGVDAQRIVLTNAGLARESVVELWIVPDGATPP